MPDTVDTSRSPKKRTLHLTVAAVALGADLTTVLFCAPFDGIITGVRYVPKGAAAGHATNNRTFSIVNKLGDASGAAVPATLVQLAGVDLAAYIPKAFTLASSNTRAVSAGDVLILTSVHGGTGVADPGGTIEVDFADGDGAA